MSSPATHTTHNLPQGKDHRSEAAAVQQLARLREQQHELQASTRRRAPSHRCRHGCHRIAPPIALSAGAARHPPDRPPACPPIAPAARCREGFVGLSVADTLRQCLRLGLKDQAARIAREHKARSPCFCASLVY